MLFWCLLCCVGGGGGRVASASIPPNYAPFLSFRLAERLFDVLSLAHRLVILTTTIPIAILVTTATISISIATSMIISKTILTLPKAIITTVILLSIPIGVRTHTDSYGINSENDNDGRNLAVPRKTTAFHRCRDVIVIVLPNATITSF